MDRLNVSKVLNVSLQQYLYHSALTRIASLAVYGRPWLKQTNVHSRTSICLQERASADTAVVNLVSGVCISLRSSKLINLSIGLRPNIGPQIKLWSQSLISGKE